MSRQWFGGHSTAILCVTASPGPEGLVASGSEEGGIAVWSQDGSVVDRFTIPGEEDVTSMTFTPGSPSQLIVSHGDSVSMFDPRNLKGPAEAFQGVGEEEINALALNENGSALAVADDSGAVRVLELPGGKVCRTLRRHTNICSSVAFRPHRPNNLVSGGLDMQVMLWGLQKTRPLWTVNLQDVADDSDAAYQRRPGQLFNPPLVHCVTVADCGNIVGCASEDGRVHLIRVGSGSKLEQQGHVVAHSQGASQAHFVGFLSHPHWLITGGNDCCVTLWDLSKHPVVAPEDQAAAPQHRKRRSKAKKGAQSQEQSETLQKAEGGEEAAAMAEVVTEKKSGPKMSIAHGDKVNWACPALLKGEPSVIVADQSRSLTVYPLS